MDLMPEETARLIRETLPLQLPSLDESLSKKQA
jgi:hypothetical protein